MFGLISNNGPSGIVPGQGLSAPPSARVPIFGKPRTRRLIPAPRAPPGPVRGSVGPAVRIRTPCNRLLNTIGKAFDAVLGGGVQRTSPLWIIRSYFVLGRCPATRAATVLQERGRLGKMLWTERYYSRTPPPGSCAGKPEYLDGVGHPLKFLAAQGYPIELQVVG